MASLVPALLSSQRFASPLTNLTNPLLNTFYQACQIAKLKGCKVIAIAGGADKCKFLIDELGVDAALDYKSPDFAKDFKKTVGYLDVYFDNVGGDILDLCLSRLKKGARIARALVSCFWPTHGEMLTGLPRTAQSAEPSRS